MAAKRFAAGDGSGHGGRPDTLAPGDRFAAQYFYWNPLWRPPDGEEFIVSRRQEREFDKERFSLHGTPSFRGHWK